MTSSTRFEVLLAELLALELPRDEFAVFGSGPLAAARLRDVNDLDVIVTGELWQTVARDYSVLPTRDGGEKVCVGEIEIFNDWKPNVGSIRDLIREADVFDGTRFVRLEKVLEWKRKRRAEKDTLDIALLERHLSER